MLKRIKVINGYTADARFFAETGKHVGYIPRTIGSPYAYSPTHIVYDWKGKPCIHVEVKHRRYEVFEVPREMIRRTEKECMA